MSDTPETDAQIFDACDGQGCEAVLAGFARKLERERNEALNKAHNYEQGYLTHATRADTLEKERDEAIRALTNIAALPTLANVVRARKIAQEALRNLDDTK